MKGIIRNSDRKRSSSLDHRNRLSQDRVLVDFLYKRSDGREKHFPQAKPLTTGPSGDSNERETARAGVGREEGEEMRIAGS